MEKLIIKFYTKTSKYHVFKILHFRNIFEHCKNTLFSFYIEKSSLSILLDGIECVAAKQSWSCIKNKLTRSIDYWNESLKTEKEAFIGKEILCYSAIL